MNENEGERISDCSGEMKPARVLLESRSEVIAVERQAWQRVQDAEGCPEASAAAWEDWLVCADKTMRVELAVRRQGSVLRMAQPAAGCDEACSDTPCTDVPSEQLPAHAQERTRSRAAGG